MSNKKSLIYEKQANVLREKLNGRDYVLGLDLGVGSIGSAVVAIDKDSKESMVPAEIVYSGSRIFPASTGASERRAFRGQRNSIRHRKNRLKWVWKVLSKKGLMLPYSTEDVSDPATLRFSEITRSHNPYELRYKGIKEKLSLEDLGYAIYHIANHRGSSSVFGEDSVSENKKASDKKYYASKDLTSKLVEGKSGITFIELLKKFADEQENKFYRNTEKMSDEIAPMPTRDLIENELNVLLDTQKEYYPDVLSDEYISEIKKAVLFENEMLVPEAGNCPYFPNEKKLPKIAFINEERRLWEAVNNVRFSTVTTDASGKTIIETGNSLDASQRIYCFNLLNSGKDITPKEIKKIFSNICDVEDIKLQGTTKKEQRITGFRFVQLRDNPVMRQLSENQQIEVLGFWQNAVSEEQFKKKTLAYVKLSESEYESLHKTLLDVKGSFQGQYAPCGLSAMKILISYIQLEGISFQEAIVKAVNDGSLTDKTIVRNCDCLPYYGQVLPASMQTVMGKAWHSAFESRINSPSFHKPNTDPNEEKYGKIANPVVHQTLNELRKLVNELIEIFGKKPKFVRIETAKELKVGQEKRDELAKKNNIKEKRNKQIFEKYCKPHNLGEKYIKIFRIYEDQHEVCPYCLKPITVDEIAKGNADLDHIFPREDIPGNPDSNLVVAHKLCNEKLKGKRIPYEAFSDNPEMWNMILQNAEENMPEKKWRFYMNSDEYKQWLQENGMYSRFKTDNSYISVVAADYMSSLFSNEELKHSAVKTIRGSETAILRKAWNLQGLTSELAVLHSPEESFDIQQKVRTDVRHHAIDAIVIAFSTQANIKQINTMSGRDVEQPVIEAMIKIPSYFRTDEDRKLASFQRDAFRSYVQGEILNNTFVSRKIDHSRNGALLKETSYSIYAIQGDKLVYGSTKKVTGLKAKNLDEIKKQMAVDFSVPKWVNEKERLLIEKRINENENTYKRIEALFPTANQILQEENAKLILSGKKERAITVESITKKALLMAGGKFYQIKNGSLSKMFMTREPGLKTPGNVYDTGSNYCLDIYKTKDGESKTEVIRKIYAMSKSFVPACEKDGNELCMRIFPYDIIEVDKSDNKVVNIAVPNAKNGRTFIIPTTFTESGDNAQIHFDSITASNPSKQTSFMAKSTFMDIKPRVVKLSSAGLVQYVTDVLK